jgi:hypothetical protein
MVPNSKAALYMGQAIGQKHPAISKNSPGIFQKHPRIFQKYTGIFHKSLVCPAWMFRSSLHRRFRNAGMVPVVIPG